MDQTKERLHLVPFGEIETTILEEIGNRLKQTFDLHVKREKALAVPEEAFAAHRQQYHSPKLLRRLRTSYPSTSEFTAVLGVIDRDLFVPQFNFVFGEANAGMRAAIIALARLRPEFYGLPPDDRLLRSRAIKEAIHEIGHTYGLTHCPDPTCVMFFSNRLEDTDEKGAELCKRHRDRLSELRTRFGNS